MVKKLLSKAQGVKVLDYPLRGVLSYADNLAGKDMFMWQDTQDPTVKNGINLWTVSDNLRKGAALNAVQIAEEIIRNHR